MERSNKMKKLITVLLAVGITQAQAQTVVITPQGNYTVQQSQSTTYVTGPQTGSSQVAVPVTVNPITGVGVVQGPQGSQVVVRSQSSNSTAIAGGRK